MNTVYTATGRYVESKHSRNISFVAKPAVSPVGHHIYVAGDVFVGYAIEYVPDGL